MHAAPLGFLDGTSPIHDGSILCLISTLNSLRPYLVAHYLIKHDKEVKCKQAIKKQNANIKTDLLGKH